MKADAKKSKDGTSGADELALDRLSPDMEVDLDGPPTGYPDDWEVFPGVRFGDLSGEESAEPRATRRRDDVAR